MNYQEPCAIVTCFILAGCGGGTPVSAPSNDTGNTDSTITHIPVQWETAQGLRNFAQQPTANTAIDINLGESMWQCVRDTTGVTYYRFTTVFPHNEYMLTGNGAYFDRVGNELQATSTFDFEFLAAREALINSETWAFNTFEQYRSPAEDGLFYHRKMTATIDGEEQVACSLICDAAFGICRVSGLRLDNWLVQEE